MSPSRAYLAYTACHAAMFSVTAATYVPWLLSIGLSLSQVTLINVAFWVTIVLFEVPTGMLADARSRAWSMRLGFALFTAGFVTRLFADGFAGALAAEIIDAVGFTFFSGIVDAWVTDALIRHGQGDEKGKVFANATIIRGLVSLPGAIIGSWAASSFGLPVIWILAAFCAILGFGVVYHHMNGDGEAPERVSEIEALRLSLRAVRVSSPLRWSVGANVVFALTVALNHLWTPYFLQWIPLANLGYLWVPIYLTFALAGFGIRRVSISSGKEAVAMTWTLVVAGAGLTLAGQMNGFVLTMAMVMFHQLGRAGFSPLLSSYTQHHVDSRHRATYGSLQSLAGEAGSAIVLLSMSLYMHGKPDSPPTISNVWLAAGVTLMMLALALYLLRPKERTV